MPKPEQTIFQSMVSHFGGQKKTATALDCDQSSVSAWVRGKNGMSLKLALRAERITGGQFTAFDLCPDEA